MQICSLAESAVIKDSTTAEARRRGGAESNYCVLLALGLDENFYLETFYIFAEKNVFPQRLSASEVNKLLYFAFFAPLRERCLIIRVLKNSMAFALDSLQPVIRLRCDSRVGIEFDNLHQCIFGRRPVFKLIIGITYL